VRARGEAPILAGRAIAVAASYRQAMNGAAILWRADGEGGWGESDRAVVGDFAGQLGIALAQLEQHEALARLARNDALTGLFNRRTFNELLAQRLAQADRSSRSGALLFVDLDNFKLVNDRFSHQRGDEALKSVADKLKQGTRVGDVVARLGGDEFALWLEDVDEAGAVAKVKLLLDYNAELAPFSGDEKRPLGMSVGIAVYAPRAGENAEALLLRADGAMYRIKHGSKNGFAVAPPAGRSS
jgi:diguanylate cyclase (GGDEF)-like protein